MSDRPSKDSYIFKSRKEVFFLKDFLFFFTICFTVYLLQGWVFNLYYINGEVQYFSKKVIELVSIPSFWNAMICAYFFRLAVRGGQSLPIFSIAMTFCATGFLLLFLGGADGTYNSYYGPLIYNGKPTLLGIGVRLFNPYVAFALASSVYLTYRELVSRRSYSPSR